MSTKNEAPKFRVDALRADLLRAVTRAETVVEARNTVPVLSFVQLAMGFGTLAVAGTDLDMEMRVEIEARGEGATCLPARRLRDLLRALPGERVTMSNDTDGIVTLLSDRTKVTYGTIPAGDFPSFSVDHRAWSLTLPDGVFAYLIGGAALAMSVEETRYYLNGVCLEVKDGLAIATATDGHRLVSRTHNLAGAIADISPVIIPRKVVLLAMRQIAGGEAVLTGYAPAAGKPASKVQIDGGNARLRAKAIDGTFPDWRRVVPTADGSVIPLDVIELLRALRIAKTTTRERGRAIKLSPESGGINITCHNPDLGDVSTPIDCEITDPFPAFGCNLEYLRGFAEAASRIGSKTLRLHVTGAGEPIKILPDEAIPGAMAVLMPMRV